MHTIWILLKNRRYKLPLVIAIIVLALISFANGIANFVVTIRPELLPETWMDTEWLPENLLSVRVTASVQPITASMADIFISVCLCLALNKENTGLRHTDTLIQRLMIYVINRGILTTVLQLGQAVTYVSSSQRGYYWTLFHFSASRVNVNSTLTILNARHHMRGES